MKRLVLVLTLGVSPALAQDVAPALAQDVSPALAQDASPALAQAPQALKVSLAEAIHGALTSSFGALAAQARVDEARGIAKQERADLLPDVNARVSAQRQVINLAAYGFPPPAGESPLVGPFGVADARLTFAQPLFDRQQSLESKAAVAEVRAAEADAADTRDRVVLLAANAYLKTLASEARIAAIEAETETSGAELERARTMRQSGLLAGVDVTRVELADASARQRLVQARADRVRFALELARLAGLPLDRPLELTDSMPYATFGTMTLDEALHRAATTRGDVQRAEARVSAAESRLKAARADRWPSLNLAADAGEIGPHADDLGFTWSVGAALRIPIFDGGRRAGDIAEAEAGLALRRAERDDVKRGAEAEVRTALLDVSSTSQALDVAESAKQLATTLLEQARDRFAAGVASSLEATQAESDLAEANERWVESLYAHDVAKASLARALGVGEEAAAQVLGIEHE